MNYIGTYQHTKIHETKLEISIYRFRFSFNFIIVRKIGISREVVRCLFLQFFQIQLFKN